MHDNFELCSKCGGACCKSQPGACFPSEFGFPDEVYENVKKSIGTGRYCLDCWEGDPREDVKEFDRTLFVRPSVTGFEFEVFDATWGGPWTFFKKDIGCELESDKRPLNCQMLEPKEDGCILHEDMGKQKASIEWIPFQKFLQKFLD